MIVPACLVFAFLAYVLGVKGRGRVGGRLVNPPKIKKTRDFVDF